MHAACCRYRRAELALSKGDEELAKEALTRRKAFQVRDKRGLRCTAGTVVLCIKGTPALAEWQQ